MPRLDEPTHIAWIKRIGGDCYQSVATGGEREVEAIAKDHINSDTWRRVYPDGAALKITTYRDHKFCKAIIIR